MSKHTPGPWVWGKHYNGLYGAVTDNAVLNTAPFEGMWLSYGESREANARLIAAAPEMYDYIAAAASNGCEQAKRLIAKATGEGNQ